MAIDPPYKLGPFETITDVHFGLDVIVVFLDIGFGINPTPIVPDKVEVLDVFSVFPILEGGPTEYMATAYKVDADAGEFMTTTGPEVTAFIFAISSGDDANLSRSLARAKDGTLKAARAQYAEHTSSTVLPYAIDPPGLLWSVFGLFPDGATVNWKLRYGEHRNGNSPTPPNSMVQCYPLFHTWTSGGVTYTGYEPGPYRLDRAGVGTSYGGYYNFQADTGIRGGHINFNNPGAWHQDVGGGQIGVKYYQDPPPLVGFDPPSS